MSLGEWANDVVPLRRVSQRPPSWAVPGIFPPGLSIVAADPKTFKSTLMLRIFAYVVEGLPPPGLAPGRTAVKVKGGTALYWAYEQGLGMLRYHYEGRILKAKQTRDSLLVVRDPWAWRIEEGPNDDWCAIIHDLKPTIAVIDPLAQAHDFDENDSRWVKYLNPIRQAAIKAGTALVAVHHTSKKKNQDGTVSVDDFGRARGTSALWGMCDSGHMLTRDPRGKQVHVYSRFKDFPEKQWSFVPPK